MHLTPKTVAELLRRRAAEEPDREAYSFLPDREEAPRATLSYGELDRQARAIAARLQSAGAAGQSALLLHPPGLDFVAGFFGCLYAGVAAVPCVPLQAGKVKPRLRAIAEDSHARLALAVTSQLPDEDVALGAGRGLRFVATDALEPGIEDSWREPVATEGSLAFLQYTSGSTSTPRGVMVTHANILHNTASIRSWLGPQTRMVSWLPTFHDMGLVGGILYPLAAGFPVTLLSPAAFLQQPSRWLETISRERASLSGGPNFAYDLCVRKVRETVRSSLDLSCWRVAFNGAEPLRHETLRRFASAFAACGFREGALLPCYGMAETTLFVAGGDPGAGARVRELDAAGLEGHQAREARDGAPAARLVECGAAAAGTRIAIVDPETAAPRPEDAIGEVWVQGPSVGQGYWNRPEETESTFRARLADGSGPFLRTGDLGFLHEGRLFVTGRLKDLIIVRGRNLYPQDIESTAEASHPALRTRGGAAFPIDEGGEERLAIVHELDRHCKEPEAVVDAVRSAVAREHDAAAGRIVLIREHTLPRTTSGKVARRPCRAGLLDGTLKVVHEWREAEDEPHPEPGQPGVGTGHRSAREIEAWLIARLSRRGPAPQAAPDGDLPFVSFGLDSAAAVGLAAELGAWLNRSLPPTLAWDYPSVGALARHLAGAPDAQLPRRPDQAPVASKRREPVAILGLGCRFPGATSPGSFWRRLREGWDGVTEVPRDRWDADSFYDPDPQAPGKSCSRWGAFLDSVDGFDPYFFGISPREAECMDPQQRLLLEVAWEALEDAALPADRLAGSRTGVFVGISSSDYGRMHLQDPAAIEAYAGTGGALSIAANRISYLLDLRGPSLAVDTACSSSLVALHLACRSLREGECDIALVGGVNLILLPEVGLAFSRAGMMAARGRCRSFDAGADGYVRGEGCAVLVLKRASDAQRDGDRVLAVVRGTAVNQDGRSNGLTAPSGRAQQEVIREALADAGIGPSDLDYVEAHGTGTPLGDPIEAQSLAAVLAGEPSTHPCWLGSVKTNIGHLEAAAGIAGVVKVVLALRHEELPRHLHLENVNPHARLEGTRLSIPTRSQPWPRSGRPRRAGVSSFGFGGTNAHAILEEAEELPRREASRAERPLHVLSLSAPSQTALGQLARAVADHLAEDPGAALADLCHTANVGRSRFRHRLAFPAASAAELEATLRDFAEGRATGLAAGQAPRGGPPPLAFLFGADGSRSPGLAQGLYEGEPAFRGAVDRCALLLGGRGAEAMAAILEGTPAGAPPLAPQSLFALEYALAETWRAWGIVPAAVLGRGPGEWVAACMAGAMELEEALHAVADPSAAAATRGRAARLPWIRPSGGPLARSIEALSRQGIRTFLEIGPEADPALAGCRRASEAGSTWLCSLERGRNAWPTMLGCLARLYVLGADVDWAGVDAGRARRKVSLPTYPFERQRYWRGPARPAPAPRRPEPLDTVDLPKTPVDQIPGPAPLAASPQPEAILRKLLQAAAALLQVEPDRIDPDMPFLEMGADSLVLIEVMRVVQREFGVSLSLGQIFEIATIAELARHLDAVLGPVLAPPPAAPTPLARPRQEFEL